jgi:hypothetical protein
MPDFQTPTLIARLRSYGADLSRWPDHQQAGREALVASSDVRRTWESERVLDRFLSAHRDAMDLEIVRSDAASRIRRRLLSQLPADPLAGMAWRSVAAAILVAGMLGGAIDLVLPEPLEPADLAMLDPLDDGADTR